MLLNDKTVMTRSVTIEWRVLTGSFHTISYVHNLFTLHRPEGMTRSFRSYSEDVVREFYASYLATLRGSLDWRANPAKQDPLTEVFVRGCLVDFSPTFPAASCMVRPLVVRGIPLLQSFIIGEIFSRVASFRGAEIKESRQRSGLHNSCPLTVRKKTDCWTLEALSERPTLHS